MTFSAACGWSLARAVVVAAVGLLVASGIARLLAESTGRVRTLAWMLLLAPFLMPGLVIGYGYRNYSLSLVHHPGWNEALYATIVACRVISIGAIVLHFAPPPQLSAQARHCRDLAAAGMRSPLLAWPSRVQFALRGALPTRLSAAAMMFLLSFQETEIASLMQANGWTEWLFTRRALGLELSATMRYAAWSGAIALLAVGPVLWWLLRSSDVGARTSELGDPGPEDRGQWRPFRRPTSEVRIPSLAASWLYLTAACIVTVGIPGWFVLRGTVQGFRVVAQQSSLPAEIVAGLLVTGTAALAALFVAWRAVEGQKPVFRILWAALLLPGLGGALVLSLAVAALFQHSWLQRAYDTPMPMLCAMTLLLFPMASVLLACVRPRGPRPPGHAARLLGDSTDVAQRASARDLWWQLSGRRWCWCYVAVFWIAYLELTVPSILPTPGMVPATVRLYNFMHYGHIAGLAAMVCVTLAVPLALLALVFTCRRALAGWFFP